LKRQRTKHPAPVLFGQRMRLAVTYENRAVWVRRYGELSARVTYTKGNEAFPYALWLNERQTYADTLKTAVRVLESWIRCTGRSLPAAALVSRKEHTELVRMGHVGVTRYFRG